MSNTRDLERVLRAADRLAIAIVRHDHRVMPGFARAVVAALVAKLGPAVLKPAPRPSDEIDVSTLVG